MESAVEYQHLLYKLRNENTEDKQGIEEQNKVDYNIFVSEKVSLCVLLPILGQLLPLLNLCITDLY